MKFHCNLYFFVAVNIIILYYATSNEMKQNVNILNIRKRAIANGLRISVEYDSNTIDKLSAGVKDIVIKLFQDASTFFKSAVQVKTPINGNLKLPQDCLSNEIFYQNENSLIPYCDVGCKTTTTCGEMTIPTAHLDKCKYYKKDTQEFLESGTAGVGKANTDLILYVTAVQTSKCDGNTIAYASHCHQDINTDRPISGNVNLCPKSIEENVKHYEKLLLTIKHEIIHALVFSTSLFAFYKDADGKPLTARNSHGKPTEFDPKLSAYKWSDNTIKQVSYQNWMLKSGTGNVKKANLVVTKNVLAEVKAHFSCDTLEGAELEDQGVSTSALTHWEKRIFFGEALSASYKRNSVISRITFALLKDSGWYDVDYSFAGDLKLGKNMGCDFATKSCMSWMTTKANKNEPILPYCNYLNQKKFETKCSINRQSLVTCDLTKYSSALPVQYQNFASIPNVESELEKYGSSSLFSDFCPYYEEFNIPSESRTSDCKLKENNIVKSKNIKMEVYGENSLCFETLKTEQWSATNCNTKTVYTSSQLGSGCYEHKCDQETGLTIKLNGNNVIQCTMDKEIIKISVQIDEMLYKGAIICPKCSDICGNNCPEMGKQKNITELNNDICKVTKGSPGSVADFCFNVVLLIFISIFSIASYY